MKYKLLSALLLIGFVSRINCENVDCENVSRKTKCRINCVEIAFYVLKKLADCNDLLNPSLWIDQLLSSYLKEKEEINLKFEIQNDQNQVSRFLEPNLHNFMGIILDKFNIFVYVKIIMTRLVFILRPVNLLSTQRRWWRPSCLLINKVKWP